MKLILKIVIGILAICLLVIGGMFATGNGGTIRAIYAVVFSAPKLPFDPGDAVDAPDYSKASSWAALPGMSDLADLRPAGSTDAYTSGESPVDVFFIHPTGFLKGSSWTFSMNANTATEENTKWMMANQASAYNGCCEVYAPRYRQASIFSYIGGDKVLTQQILDFAYVDVAQAFDYFLKHYSQGRPFIIASHSQGTHHALQLLEKKIDQTPLAKRLVAAFMLGGVGAVQSSRINKLKDISVCSSAESTQCLVHWDTFSVAVIEDEKKELVGNVCVNPLTWTIDGGPADKQLHVGAQPPSGKFSLQLSGDDSALGTEFMPLAAALPNYLAAQCKQGALYVTDISGTEFDAGLSISGSNYHLLDYPLFHADIRENAKLRVASFLGLTPR